MGKTPKSPQTLNRVSAWRWARELVAKGANVATGADLILILGLRLWGFRGFRALGLEGFRVWASGFRT